jgi:hypothetical protein
MNRLQLSPLIGDRVYELALKGRVLSVNMFILRSLALNLTS